MPAQYERAGQRQASFTSTQRGSLEIFLDYAEATAEMANKMQLDPSINNQTPHNPVTPTSADAALSLHNLIQHEMSQQRVQKCLQRLTNATQLSFAELVLLREQNQFLTTTNEASVRRSTKSVVVGTARIMSYEDLEKAREDRAAKEAGKEAKKRGETQRRPEALRLRQEQSLPTRMVIVASVKPMLRDRTCSTISLRQQRRIAESLKIVNKRYMRRARMHWMHRVLQWHGCVIDQLTIEKPYHTLQSPSVSDVIAEDAKAGPRATTNRFYCLFHSAM